jgi:hypothetical protein
MIAIPAADDCRSLQLRIAHWRCIAGIAGGNGIARTFGSLQAHREAAMKRVFLKDRPAFAPPALPPEDPWEPPPLAPEAIDPAEPAGGWSKKVWQTLTGAASPRRGYPRAELPMTCGVHNRPFIVVAELRGDTCFFVDNILAGTAAAAGGETSAPSQPVGSFQYFDAHPGWKCPHCGARDNPVWPTHLVWFCCNKMICAGSIGRSAYCACGYFAERYFTCAKAGDPAARRDVWGTQAGEPAAPRSLPPPPRLLSPPARQFPPSGFKRIGGPR